MAGDATDEKVLLEAGIHRAESLATVLPDDAANVFITLSARNLNRDLRIIARGEVPSTESKLLQAGATHVVLPAHIGAERVVHLLLFPDGEGTGGAQTLGDGLAGFGVSMEQTLVARHSKLAGLTISALAQQASGDALLVALHSRDGGVTSHPSPDLVVNEGDALVWLVREGRLTALQDRFEADPDLRDAQA